MSARPFPSRLLTITLWLVASAMVGGYSTKAQSLSNIGSHLFGGDAFKTVGPIDITPDGEWIYFVHGSGAGSSGFVVGWQEISRIRTDGTGYELLVDRHVMQDLEANGDTTVEQFRVSGDGRRIWFSRWHQYIHGIPYGPLWDYLVDVETGTVEQMIFNGADVGQVSFTDDGSRMVFAGNNDRGTWSYFLSDPDMEHPVEFLAPLETWYTAVGVVSGDGSKFAFLALLAPFSLASDVFVYDFATGVTTKVSKNTLNEIRGVDISGDGSRVVYARGPAAGGVVYGVNADGSNHHLIYTGGTGGTATISRDGQHVFLEIWVEELDGPRGHRVHWSGNWLEMIDVWNNDPTFLAHRPVSGDGQVYAGWKFLAAPEHTGGVGTLRVWHAQPAVLTTYGHGLPDTTLHWDVGARPGDSYLLAWSVELGAQPVGLQGYGLLELDPDALGILTPGIVEGPDNVGHVEIDLPPDVVLPRPMNVHFQALVLDAGGAGGRLTNRTSFTIDDGVAAAASASAPPAGVSTSPAASARPAHDAAPFPRGRPGSLSSDELLRELRLHEPWLHQRLEPRASLDARSARR